MAIQIAGNAGVVAEVDANRAVSTVIRPTDWGALGAYSKALTSGTMAAALASGSSIFQFRNSTSNVYLLRRVFISAGDLVAFTAGLITFQLTVARNFTANGSGGTAATLTGNTGKLRTSMATTGTADIRISSTAALTAGTWTLDGDPIGAISTSAPATAGVNFLPQSVLFDRRVGEQPLILAQNEGFNISATVPATGTWQFSVQVDWEELASY